MVAANSAWPPMNSNDREEGPAVNADDIMIMCLINKTILKKVKGNRSIKEIESAYGVVNGVAFCRALFFLQAICRNFGLAGSRGNWNRFQT